ncbi:MAG: hypothetical protein SOR78_05990 [Baileyella intestinalis]|nr:hypothetical protein [Baileyella intestinalis]MDY2995291.1 hypothetical protein [Baileyella intestinalis]
MATKDELKYEIRKYTDEEVEKAIEEYKALSQSIADSENADETKEQ